jgi:hypothetical protein
METKGSIVAILFVWTFLRSSDAYGQEVRVVDTGSSWNVSWRAFDDDDPRSWERLDQLSGPLETGGWMSAGFTTNAHGNRTGNGNAPLPLNNVADAPVLNQIWLYAEKRLDLDNDSVDWGLRIDYLFGADAPDSQAVGDQGWDYGWNTSRDYGSAIPQVYAELGFHRLTFRAGYGLGLKGYEATQAVDNFFYSHNYAFGYGVPGTHSGVALEYGFNERLQLIGTWTTGWDSWWSNYLSASTFLGGLTWTLSDQTSLTYHATAGDFGDGTAKNGAQSNGGRIYAHAMVLSHENADHVGYVLEHTLGSNTGLGPKDNRWYSVTHYCYYTINDCWEGGLRFEWFRDEDGQRVDVNGTGPGSFYEATLGVNWQPHTNTRLRPEIRWDWFVGEGRPYDSRDGGMTGTAVNQFTGGVDVVIGF